MTLMEQNKAPSLVAIIACYYPAYFEQAIKNLERLLTSIKPEFQIIVINNNDQPIKHKGLNVVKGSNQCWEFSAWDEGIEFMTNNYSDFTQSTFVFLNDTFFTHRVFTFLDFYLFKKSIQKVVLKKCDFSGEVNSFGETFYVNTLGANKWVSTYLFALQASKLKTIGKFCKFDQQNSNLQVNTESKKITIDECSENLLVHLEKWFFPKNPKLGWYKNSSNPDNNVFLKQKITAVLNEKLLSIHAVNAKLEFDNVYGNQLAKIYLLGRKFLYKFVISSIKKFN
jgi:hypothetical protein